MFALDPTTVSTDELIAQVRALGDELYERREAVRRGQRSGTNLAKGTERFVGRGDELAQLGEALATTGTIGVVTAVQGIGGIGKTELVRQYGHRNQAAFPAGVWQLAAERHTQMLPLLASLANDLPGFTIPDDIRTNPTEVGRLVRSELINRTQGGQSVLLILDNVSELALLGPAEIGELPAGRQFHVAATTRLGAGDFLGHTRLAHVPIGGLSHPASVELLRLHQFDLTGDGEPDFRSTDDEAAAHELATLLGGFTLAVELAAVYLMTHPDISIRDYLNFLHHQGVTGIDDLSDPSTTSDLHHQDAVLKVVIDSMLHDVEATVPGAALVLHLAAAMPPETVAWPWLEHLARELDPTIFEPSPQDLSGRWMRIRRALEGRSLIEEGRHPGHTGRIHRLLAQHLTTPEAEQLIDGLALERAQTIGRSQDQPEQWELDTIVDALARPLSNDPDRLGQIIWFFQDTLLRYPTDGRHRTLLEDVRHHSIGRTQLVACGTLGRSLQNENPEQALGFFSEELALARRIADTKPDDILARSDLTVSLENVARMLRNREPDQAVRLYEESLTISRRLAATRPDDLQAQRDLTISLDNVAGMLANRDPDQAVRLYEESLTITRQLATTRPDDLQAQRDLTISLNSMAGMLANRDPDQAVRLCEESLTTFRWLAKARPDDLQAQRDLTASLNSMAGMLANRDPDRAVRLYEESLAIARRLAEEYPGDLEAQHDLTVSLDNVARMLRNRDPDQAMRLYQESLTISRQLATTRPDDLQAQRDLTISLDNVAGMLANRDPDRAVRLYEESLAIARRLAHSQLDDLQAQRDLTISLNNVARMLRSDDPRQAFELHLQSLEIRRELADRAPTIQSMQDQGLSAAQVAQLLDPASEPARKLWHEAATCLRRAWEAIPDDPVLARQAWGSTSEYLRCRPGDAADWQPFVEHLVERFGFE